MRTAARSIVFRVSNNVKVSIANPVGLKIISEKMSYGEMTERHLHITEKIIYTQILSYRPDSGPGNRKPLTAGWSTRRQGFGDIILKCSNHRGPAAIILMFVFILQ